MVVEVVISGQEDWDALRERLANLTPALEKIAKALISAGKAAFNAQQFGDTPWPARYPSQGSPSLNIAGLISDLNAGKEPPTRRFQDRQAGMDGPNGLSTQYRSTLLGPHGVEVENFSSHAQAFHEGGPFSMPVLPETVTRLRAFVESHKQYRRHLSRFIGENPPTEYDSKNVRRPLLGVPGEIRQDLVDFVEAHLGGSV